MTQTTTQTKQTKSSLMFTSEVISKFYGNLNVIAHLVDTGNRSKNGHKVMKFNIFSSKSSLTGKSLPLDKHCDCLMAYELKSKRTGRMYISVSVPDDFKARRHE